ncbi:MAG: HisA/HisF-related TIM barrel protein [Polyangiaceae bacterium]
MIVPSIDLMGGQAVQLVGGKEKVLDAGDPRPIAERFSVAGEIAVVDLDAALGKGDNAALIRDLCRIAPCRVGGGIRDADTALRWLDAGATKVVLGTAAVPEVLSKLPARPDDRRPRRDRRRGFHGWRTRTGRRRGAHGERACRASSAASSSRSSSPRGAWPASISTASAASSRPPSARWSPSRAASPPPRTSPRSTSSAPRRRCGMVPGIQAVSSSPTPSSPRS